MLYSTRFSAIAVDLSDDDLYLTNEMTKTYYTDSGLIGKAPKKAVSQSESSSQSTIASQKTTFCEHVSKNNNATRFHTLSCLLTLEALRLLGHKPLINQNSST